MMPFSTISRAAVPTLVVMLMVGGAPVVAQIPGAAVPTVIDGTTSAR